MENIFNSGFEDAEREISYVILSDKEGKIIDFTQDSEIPDNLNISLSKEDIGEKTIDDYISTWDFTNGDNQKIRANIYKKENFEFHDDFTLKEGIRHMHIAGQRLVSGNYIIKIRDETELTHLKRRLEETVRRYDESIATVAHDFRSPLCTIKGFTELVLEEIEDYEKKRHLKRVINSVNMLESLATRFLNSYKINNGEFSVKRSNIAPCEIIRSVEEVIAHDIFEKEAEIKCSDSLKNLRIVTDAQLLDIVYRNLIGNAVKYGGQKTKISLDYHGEKEKHIFSVSNTGSYISKHDSYKLFRPFSKIDSSKPGTGLGLNNVKNILKNYLKGDIDLYSSQEDPRSTEFRFYIPRSSL